ncbi:hypothetical protein [Cognaticolwellia aestuarii]|uniref:hypothetical protein n=1 Tax=Cognaticolwellia aestuarii TaxID=329993 RepID=UPI000985DE0B|nr:hypothetical protein [Cognaticolwellia aestuarii]
MKLTTLVLSLSLISLYSSANEYETTVGLGHQYGGVLGAQFAYKTASTKYYAALGLVGVSAGFQTTFSENSHHAYGLSVGQEEIQSEDGFIFATYDYHFNGFLQDGLVIGTGIGITREDKGGFYSDSGQSETSAAVTLSIGYKF